MTNFHRNTNSDRRSTRVMHQAKAPSAASTQATGSNRGLLRRAFATRGALGRSKGSGAPAPRRAYSTLAVLSLAIAAFALTAAPAVAAPPTVTTPVVSSVSYTSAHVTGEATSDGSFFGGTAVSFQYSTDESDWKTGFSRIFFDGAFTNREVEGNIEGLKTGTEYFVRIIANNGFEVGQETPVPSPEPNPSFTTLVADPPSVEIADNASEVQYTTASVSGKVNRPEKSDNLTCNFEYITDEQFTANQGSGVPVFEGATPTACEPSPVATVGSSTVKAKLTGLANATAYHLRLAVTGAGGTDAKDAAQTFTTLTVDPPSVISTDNASEVEYTQAQVKGVVNRPDNADPAFDVNCHFQYVTDDQFNENPPGEEFAGATSVDCNPNPVTAADTAPGTTKEVKTTLGGLAPSTTYHLRLAVSNQGGSDAKAAAATFTTKAGPIPAPTVTAANDATDISYKTVKASGVVVRPAGTDPALDIFGCRFEFITAEQFDANEAASLPGFEGAGQAQCQQTGSGPITSAGPNPVSADLNNLKSGATYHLRLVAENAGGTDTETANSFTTIPGGDNVWTTNPNAGGYSTVEVFGTVKYGLGLEDETLRYVFELAEVGTENWSGCCAGGKYVPPGPGTQPISFKFTGLTQDTEYKFRIKSSNSFEVLTPEPYPTFTTRHLEAPSAALDPVTTFTGTTAHFTGTIDTNAPAGPLDDIAKAGYRTEWQIECTPACPGPGGEPYSGTVQGEEGSKAISVDANHLEANTHYVVKLIAHNEIYSAEAEGAFDTDEIPPTVKQTPGAPDGKAGYTLQGVVNPNNQTVTACEFKWGPDAPAYAFSAPCSPLPSSGGRDEVQSIRIKKGFGSPVDGGQFKLTYRGQTTADIPFDASAAEVQAALEALPAIGPGSVAVTGGWTVTFQGSLGHSNVAQLTVQNGTVPIYSNDPGGFAVSMGTATVVDGRGNVLPITVEAHLTGLNTGVDYHSLLVVKYGADIKIDSGEDQEFKATLDPAENCPANEQIRKENSSLALPECRAYEMVTPPGKEGFDAALRAYDGGNRVLYVSSAGNIAKSGQGQNLNFYVTGRTADGWETRPNLNGSSGSLFDTPNNLDPFGLWFPAPRDYSSDLLSSVWVLNKAGSMDQDIYLRGPAGTFTLLGKGTAAQGTYSLMLGGTSDDLSHLFITSTDSPTPWGPGVYEFVGTGHDQPTRRVDLDNTGNPICAGARSNEISRDGRVAVVSACGSIWARIDGTTSVNVSASQCNRIDCNAPTNPTFQGAAPDGSRIFFTTTQQLLDADTDETNDLYACDIPAGTPAPVGDANPCSALRQVSAVDPSGAVVESFGTSSEDGSTVLFTAKGVLADNEDALKEKAVAGDHNLYVWRTDAAHPDGQTAFVGRLDSDDLDPSGAAPAQATPDGRYLVFTTASQLVPTDTDNARDIYRYDAVTGQLTRASTNVFGVGGNGESFDAKATTTGYPIDSANRFNPPPSVTAISDDGQRIVFTTSEALSPVDGNGEPDVYLWTPARVSLISTGSVRGGVSGGATSGDGLLAVISGSGRDIYFQTPGALTPADGDESVDVYDARIDGGFSFVPAPVCSGAGGACQSHSSGPAPAPIPTTAQPPADPGNVKTCPKGKVAKGNNCVKRPHKKHHGKKHHSKKHKRANSNSGGGK